MCYFCKHWEIEREEAREREKPNCKVGKAASQIYQQSDNKREKIRENQQQIFSRDNVNIIQTTWELQIQLLEFTQQILEVNNVIDLVCPVNMGD